MTPSLCENTAEVEDVDRRSLHARMSTAVIGWLGDAVGDYARDLLANDMDALVAELAAEGVTVAVDGD